MSPTRVNGINELLKIVQFNDQGLIPAVIQDERTKRVLTLCYLHREALEQSLTEGTIYVFRRSQNRLMLKGETSGHIQTIRQVQVDCEGKSLVLLVRQRMAACHAGYFSCYYRRLGTTGRVMLFERQVFDPKRVY